jgi:lipoprotein-anchoring transpeptidase ErfK/SrfK
LVGSVICLYEPGAAAVLGAAAPAAAVQASGPVIDAAPEPVAQLTPAPLTAVPVQPPPAAGPLLAAAPAVDVYYQARGNAPLWFRDTASLAAAKLLPVILRRGEIEGLANAGALASVVEAAIARAQTPPPPAPAPKKGAKPAAPSNPFAAEDKILSAAWVQYVRALHGSQSEMSFGDPALAPKPPLPDRILHLAQQAPSLAQHIQSVSSVNPVYARLRDIAWSKVRPDPQLQLVSASAAVDEPVLTNLRRARLLPAKGRYLVVNLATAKLWMYEDGRAADSMKVVIGKADTPTPMLAGTIHFATFNPYWNIPTDVTRRVVAPLVIKRGVSYLKAARYEVASDWTDQASVVDPATIDWKAVADGTVRVRIRQLPGARNMMGAIKFGFVNDHGIYLHDTPAKHLFAKARRAFSLGCVRVEDAQRLARWLFGGEPPAPTDVPEQHVRLGSPVPIFLTHLTLPDEAPADPARLSSAAIVDPLAGSAATSANR